MSSLVTLLLGAVTASLGQNTLASLGLTKDLRATRARNHGLGMGEDSSDVKASRALDVPERAVRALNQTLELVLALLNRGGRLQKVDGHAFYTIQTHTQAQRAVIMSCANRRNRRIRERKCVSDH